MYSRVVIGCILGLLSDGPCSMDTYRVPQSSLGIACQEGLVVPPLMSCFFSLKDSRIGQTTTLFTLTLN